MADAAINADDFARNWIEAWNSHDLDRILSHYAEDAIISSPVAAVRVPGSGGIVRGHDGLRAYWGPALEAMPNLHFTLDAVLTAVDGCTILYRNHREQFVAESVFWNAAGLVTQAFVAYGPT